VDLMNVQDYEKVVAVILSLLRLAIDDVINFVGPAFACLLKIELGVLI
jgi:hypothetical protein